jgi:hypothetical protein
VVVRNGVCGIKTVWDFRFSGRWLWIILFLRCDAVCYVRILSMVRRNLQYTSHPRRRHSSTDNLGCAKIMRSAVCTNRTNPGNDCNLWTCMGSMLIYVFGWGDSEFHMCQAVIRLDSLWRNVNGRTIVNSANVLHNRVKPDCWLLVEPLKPGNFSSFPPYTNTSHFSTYGEDRWLTL